MDSMVPASEYKKLKEELEYVSTSLKSIAAKLELGEMDHDMWPETVEGNFNSWFDLTCKRLDEFHTLLEEYKEKVRDAETNERRWANRMRDLENRHRHAMQIMSGDVSVPSINQYREMQGLEPLPQLGGEYARE